MPKWLSVILSILALVAGIILTLFIASRVAGYDSTLDLINYLVDYLDYIWNDRLIG